ncbi:ABC transporter substrate-binding protein [Shinella pollutisoli]|uniref:Polyamine ABC transporter substrate-binding protein n=1 Tax=Shinella pollutisoli TaxID=2250594 RepID=A0ABV7DKK3_9HYPH|nr:polyamine ABC transporter substrate-binding protein [Shinella pollutisoli]
MQLTRRALLGSTAALGLASAFSGLLGAGRALAQSGSVTIATSGGAFEEALRAAFFTPYQEANPSLVMRFDTPDDPSRLKAMVEAGNVTVDLWTTGDYFGFDSDAEWLEEIDYSVVDGDALLPGRAMKYRVGLDIEQTLITYRTDAFPNGGPQTLADFFDVEKFPGMRACWKWVAGGIFEAALLADGVKKEDLYPLDIERALAKLETIRDSIIWWDTGAQSQQLLTSGEAAMGILWGSRAFPAMEAAPIGVAWGEWFSAGTWCMVPKGAANKEEAFKVIAFAVSTEPQIKLTSLLPYGPTNAEAAKRVDERYKGNLPTDHLDTQIAIDNTWWIANQAAVDTRFQEWLLG